MKIITPDYYTEFKCTADKCAHNCCIGWEIDIDDKTYDYYKSIDGDFGKRLQGNIAGENGTHYFILGGDERCPFLNSRGLCDIILTLGEDKLCQICTDHPRFRSFFSGRTEIGLGLSCEAAAKLILCRTEKMRLVTIEGGDTGACSKDEEDFFLLREQLFGIIQNRENPIRERISEVLNRLGFNMPHKTAAEWARIYMGLEQLDSAWASMLADMPLADKAQEDILRGAEWDIAFEQLVIYFLYRHMADGLYDGRLRERILFAFHGAEMIHFLCASHAVRHGKVTVCDMTDIARRYSAEIEYSENNIDTLLELLSTFPR